MTSEAAALDTPLWAFSLSVYGAKGVAEECLALQERLKLDVNVLLFAAFAGAAEGVELTSHDIAGAIAEVSLWHDAVVRALRGVRQALKPVSLDDGDPLREPAAGLRANVKAAELRAEKIEQGMLWLWSRRHLSEGKPRAPADALAVNLERVLVHYGAGADDRPLSTLRRLYAAALAFQGSKA
jgi:uncharacterized protein (TIGR02444 family)